MLQTRAPRKIKVMIPQVDDQTQIAETIKPTNPKGGLLELVKND